MSTPEIAAGSASKFVTDSEPRLVAGIDIGGTNIKAGIVELNSNEIRASSSWSTPHDEQNFMAILANELEQMQTRAGQICAAGVSIGSYVFADGSIDGMSSFVPFLTHGYPLQKKLQEALGVEVRVDNDARLICLAEACDGAGAGFSRVLTLTLGTGIGVGLCADGHPTTAASYIHLAGHIKVRNGGEYPCLDSEPCYCGQAGCFESTCSGTSLQKYVHEQLGAEVSNAEAFERATQGDSKAQAVIGWYLDMLVCALNQYVYLYCPDVIVIGGGVAKGLAVYEEHLNAAITAEVYEGQKTHVRITELREDSGILGAAALCG